MRLNPIHSISISVCLEIQNRASKVNQPDQRTYLRESKMEMILIGVEMRVCERVGEDVSAIGGEKAAI